MSAHIPQLDEVGEFFYVCRGGGVDKQLLYFRTDMAIVIVIVHEER